MVVLFASHSLFTLLSCLASRVNIYVRRKVTHQSKAKTNRVRDKGKANQRSIPFGQDKLQALRREIMEDPGTPSSDTWWKLMGDAPATPRAPRTPLTPRSFASLWANPKKGRSEESYKRMNNDPANENSVASRKSGKESAKPEPKSAEKKQPRRSTDTCSRLLSSSRREYEESSEKMDYRRSSDTSPSSEKIDNSQERSNGNDEDEFIYDSPLKATPLDRITVTHHDRKSPTSPLSVHSKKRESSAHDDAFEDNGSYVEGTADKFLDILEDRVCTLELGSPSISEIEKRIEESWREIENKTSEFFKCRRRSQEASDTPSQTRIENNEIEEKEGTSSKSKTMTTCSDGEQNDKPGKDDEDDAQGAVSASPESNDSQDDEEDSCDDEYDSAEPSDGKHQCTRRSYRKCMKESNAIGDDDDELESIMRDTVDLNSYTGTFMELLQERTGTAEPISKSESESSVESTDYDGSTLTTVQTQSLVSLPPPSLKAPTLALPPLQEEKPKRKAAKEQAETSLTIFEPTNYSALLVKNSNTVATNRMAPMRFSADGKAAQGHYERMPDLDPHFKRSCFSPTLGRKQGVSFGILNSASTGSTVQSGKSRKSEDSANSQNAYIAYFQRGPHAQDVIRLYEHPTPQAFPTLNHEVVVRIAYSTISHTDCAVRRGSYWGEDSLHPLNLPIIPGVSFSGYVSQLNRAAMRGGLRYGDRVLSLVRVGANARHLCIARDRVVTIPDELTDDKKIACLPEIYLGAFQVLHMGQKNGARYKKSSLSGKSVLILGGATILGKALIELCHAAGAYAVYATGKERHFPIIEASKATPLNRDPRHWYSLLKGRIDLVVGLDNDSFGHSEASAQHLEVLSPKGRAILFGAPECTCDATVDGRKRIFVYNVFDSWENDLKQGKRDLSHLCKLLVDRSIDPHVLETIPLNHIPEAHDTVEHRDFSSFLLCDPWAPTKRPTDKATPPTIVYSGAADVALVSRKSKTRSRSRSRSKLKEKRSSDDWTKEDLLSI